MDERLSAYEDGTLVVDDDTIVYVGPDRDIPPAFLERVDEVLDLSDTVVIPSFINCHTHLGMVAFRTLGDDVADRLKRFLIPLENECMTEELAVASARLAMAEMQLAGVGAAVDMYFFEVAIAEAAVEMGFRLWAGETLMSAPHCDVADVAGGLEVSRNLISSFAHHPLITPIIAPHAPYSTSFEELKLAQQLAREQGLLWTMHLSEMEFEMRSFRDTYGTTPIGQLSRLGLLDDSLLAVHCIHASDEDIHLIAQSGTSVVHCPGANIKAAKGLARIPAMLKQGIGVGLGTDGPSSGNTLDLFTQMKLYAILHKNELKDRTAIAAKSVVPLCTSEAAKVLKAYDRIGSLEVGKRADILVLGLDAPNMVPAYDPYSLIVYSSGVQNVRHVFTNGEWVVRDHQLTRVDLKRLKADFLRLAHPFFEAAKRF
jgi:cytosine/adenosine deaminase-related metal-dependent hydrolase